MTFYFNTFFLDSLNYCFAQSGVQIGRIPVWGDPKPRSRVGKDFQ